jgi:TolB-like protein/tetratricopeptide (TPR) repeat protein
MPFANLSGDPSQEYFSDGLSEELRTSLARLQGLQVASRSSSVSFKGKPGTADEIGQKLHVAALLEGSVRRYDSNVRISVQLVDAKSGFEVWSQSYDRELKDILALQSEIAAAVAQGLRLKLVDNIPDVIGAGGTANPQALDLYLRANRAAVKVSLQGQLEALSLCNEAIRLDSAYAKAYAFRAQREAILAGSYDPIERVASRLAESRRDIERAIELTPRDPLFHSAYAALLTIYLDFAAAQREYEKAGELPPDLVETLGSRAKFEGYLGNRSEVLRLTQRIVQLNSAHAQSYVNGAAGLASVGLYEDALKFVDRADVMGAANSIQVRCIALVWSKRDDEVISRCSQEEDLAPMQAFVAIALSRKNRKQEADALLQKIVKDNGDAAAYQYALIDSQRGDTVGALKWIEKAYELKDGGLIDMKQDPLLDPIRNQPRFQAVLKKLNFPT